MADRGRAESSGEWRIPGGAVCNGNGEEGLLAGGADCSGAVATGALQRLVIGFQRLGTLPELGSDQKLSG